MKLEGGAERQCLLCIVPVVAFLLFSIDLYPSCVGAIYYDIFVIVTSSHFSTFQWLVNGTLLWYRHNPSYKTT